MMLRPLVAAVEEETIADRNRIEPNLFGGPRHRRERHRRGAQLQELIDAKRAHLDTGRGGPQ